MNREVAEVDSVLHEEACELAGCEDFGDDYYRDGLVRMLSDMCEACGGGEAFLTSARFLARSSLVGRLYSERGWAQRPEVLETRVVSPVVIVGVPRTGTTMMHKLLSMDEGFQVLQNWLIAYPMVRPPRASWEGMPEFRAMVEEVASQPEHRHVTHYVGADEAEECLMLVNQSFVSVMYGSALSLADYDKWMMDEDWTRSLQRHSDNLRLIGAAAPDRQWLLKNPSYVLAMRELFSVYPDAKVVWMHRHPREAVGSLVDMMWTFAGGDPHRFAARELRLWSEGVRRTEEVRADHNDAFFDVDYRKLMADPLGVSRELFEWLGTGLGEATESRMRCWLGDNPQGKHGVHRYDPADLGVTDDAVRGAFGWYMDRYGLL